MARVARHKSRPHSNPKGDQLGFWWFFKISFTVNLFSVIFNVLNDCDEVYNYWEPLHFISTLGEGGGFQTWEYSPIFGLRSYLYLWLTGWPAFVCHILGLSGWFAFLSVRLHLALWSSLAVGYLSTVLERTFTKFPSFGLPLPIFFLLFTVCSPGNFLSCTSLVPSAVAVSLCGFMLASWIDGHYALSVFSVAMMSILFWPFVAVLGIPLALHMAFTGRIVRLILYTIGSALAFTIPLIVVDWIHFGRLVIAPLNIVFYNIFQSNTNVSGSASQLYGTEPISFYLKNYLLNMNIAAILAFCFVPLALLYLSYLIVKPACGESKRVIVYMASSIPFLIWNGIFFIEKHKEERFLFPCYPCLTLCASLLIFELVQLLSNSKLAPKIGRWTAGFLTFTLILVFILLSFSRVAALIRWYRAPIHVIRHIPPVQSNRTSNNPVLLCLGRDWHHFPSRFLLPQAEHKLSVRFLPSNFSGQLPGLYSELELSFLASTSRDGSRFNTLNREESDRFVSPATCHYIMDRDSEPGVREELYLNQSDQWVSVVNQTILDSPWCPPGKSKYFCSFVRSFYIPYFSETVNHVIRMHILQRIALE